MGKISEQIYCAFCKIKRRAYTKKHVSWTNVVLCSLFSFLLMIFFWQGFNAKVMVLFVIALALCEAFVQIRWRLSSCCPYCGFDPILYLTNQPKAVSKVKTTLEQRKASADFVLAEKNPFENLPRLEIPADPVESVASASPVDTPTQLPEVDQEVPPAVN